MIDTNVTAKPDLVSLAGRILASAEGDLASPVVEEAQRSLQNIVATSIGGLESSEVGHALRYFERHGSGSTEVLGIPTRLAPHCASVLIGLSAHLDDFDDTHLGSSCHASASAFSAGWAAAQMEGARPERFFSAFAHGCEIQLRVGWAMMPWHYDRGWHMTGTVGSLGAATSAGIVLGLSPAQMANALSLACSQSLGLREAFGTAGKPFHPGKAAANGLLAAVSARAGITASPDALLDGFYAVLSSDHVADRIADAFGDEWLLLENTYKPYPCGVVIHPLIDLGMEFRDKGVQAEDVTRVEVRAHPIVRELTGNPNPQTPLEARFSGVHGLSLGLVFGKAGVQEFNHSGLESPSVSALRQKIELVDDESVGWVGTSGKIHLRDGTSVSASVEHARGSIGRPLTHQELHEKFVSQVEPVFHAGASELWDSLTAADLVDRMLLVNRAHIHRGSND